MKNIEKILYSQKLQIAVDDLMRIGIDDNLGLRMFNSASVTIEDENKIIIKLKMNNEYLEEYESRIGELPQRKGFDMDYETWMQLKEYWRKEYPSE